MAKRVKPDVSTNSVAVQEDENVRFIKQPYPVSTMRGDLSLQQTHILVEMMDAIQDGIEKLFQSQAPSGGQQLMLFKEEDFDSDGLVHIDVKFNKLVTRPDAYRDVEKIAEGMMRMFIKDEDAEGGTTVTLTHFLDSISYPKKGSKRDSIRFSFSRRQARQLFNFARYSKYVKAIARNAKSQYTARLYMLITGNRKFGKWIVPYEELRRILGCDPYCEEKKQYGLKWDAKTKEWVDGRKYPLYKSFKMRILKTAESELKEFAEQGKVECYFDFQEVYSPNSKGGDPEKIEFIIHTSRMGELEDLRTIRSIKYREMQDFMEANFDMSYNDCKPILSKVDDEFYEQFAVRMKEIDVSIRKQGSAILSKKKYAVTCLNEAIKEFCPMEESKEEGKIVDTDNSAVNAETEERVEEKKIVVPKLSEEVKSSWNRFAELLKEKISAARVKFWATGMELWGVKDRCVYVVVPSAFYAEEFQKNYDAELKESFAEAFGESFTVSCTANEECFLLVKERK